MESTLVIYAHPETEGYNSFTLAKIKERLREKGSDYEIINLYKDNYNPVLKEEEHYTAGNEKLSKKNQKYQEKISEADDLIFVYPVWWGSMPAILKGFLDRTLTPGFAFTFERDSFLSKLGVPKGLLNKKAAVFMTFGGPRFLYFLTGNPPKKIIKYFTLFPCGIKSRVYQTYNARNLNKREKGKIKNKIEKGLEWLKS